MIESLSRRHAEILVYMVEQDTHVEAGTGSESPAIAHFSTLQAMARRGLVELSWKRQDGLYGSAKPYRIARITEVGRAAVVEEKVALQVQAEIADSQAEAAVEASVKELVERRAASMAAIRAQLHATAVAEADDPECGGECKVEDVPTTAQASAMFHLDQDLYS